MPPEITARRIGREREAIVTVDGFHPDPDALRRAAALARFEPARRHYPGLRAALPDGYFDAVRAVLVPVIAQVFGHRGALGLIDASFSIVTTPPDALDVAQRLPHVDAIDPDRIALVHYLCAGDGTAFFRHRATGFETIDAARSPGYLAALAREERAHGPPPPAYIRDSTAQFERIAGVDARVNRAVIYRGAALHSGAISADAPLDPDPATGRLTITAFLALR